LLELPQPARASTASGKAKKVTSVVLDFRVMW
jgi:hypothetical protein